MTTRVEEDARKAAEAERLNQKIQKEARDAKSAQTNREAFGKLVKTGQQTSADAKGKAAKAQTDAKQGEAQGQKVQKEAAAQNRNTRAARGGIQQDSKAMEQARSFSGVLTSQQSTTQQTDKGRVERRDDGKAKDRVERDDRQADVKKVETRKENEAELARVEAREHARPNAAIDTSDRGESDGRGKDGGAAAMGAVKAAALQSAGGPAAAHVVKQIPPEMIEKLVSAVYLGVNDKGLKEFQIELKDGPLKGASVRISADDGKVALSFSGLDADTKRLVEASKGDLMRRLGAKGLTLSRLDVK